MGWRVEGLEGWRVGGIKLKGAIRFISLIALSNPRTIETLDLVIF